jgi:hypothetical protein
MDAELLRELARHQVWADAEHWKALHANPALLADEQIRTRLKHTAMVCEMLQMIARGTMPATMKDRDSMDEVETAMRLANESLLEAVSSLDLDRMCPLPRGPKGPFGAPAGVLLLQVMTHGQHHRGQNAARMRELGAKPPVTDFILWYALGKP